MHRCITQNKTCHGTKGSLRLLKVNYSAYSPDLAPCDFFLFGYLKENLAGQCFHNDEELFSGMRAVLAAIPGKSPVSVLRNGYGG
jgi:hypothetical protein